MINKQRIILERFLCSILLILPTVTAQGIFSETPVDIPTVVFTFVSLVIGIYFCFLSQYSYRVTTVLASGVMWGLVAFICVKETNHIQDLGILFPSVFGSALLGGFIWIYFRKLARIPLGCLGGITLGFSLLSVREGFLIQNHIIAQVFVAVLALVGLISVYFVKKYTFIFHSAMLGSYMTILPLDELIGVGFKSHLAYYWSGSSALVYAPTGKIYAMIGGLFGLVIVSALFQLYTYRPQ
ncbi:hypothetical protein K7432_010402, partial [Basidiobolus ranarum]